MKKAGYDEGVAAALTCTAACLGPIIPPSIPFIIYGVSANVSIAGLFVGGVLPGIVLAAALMAYMSVVATRRDYPGTQKNRGRKFSLPPARPCRPYLCRY